MLLCTWYDGLESWQLFARAAAGSGRELPAPYVPTHGTIAYATRLIAAS
jgi:hypothetical protein